MKFFLIRKMSATRLEIDVKRLLSVCEDLAQNNSSDDWRLSKVGNIYLAISFDFIIYSTYKCMQLSLV